MTQRRRSTILLVFLIAILIAIPVLIFVGKERPEGKVQQLRDGTDVYLKAVTYGTAHSVGKNMYGLKLPFPIERYNHKTDRSALVFWVFVEPRQADGFDAAKWDTINTVLDDSGCSISQAESRSSTFGPVRRAWVPRSFLSVKAFIFETFPRRGSKLVLRLADRKGLEPTIELETQNPIDRAFPIWTAEPMPISRTDHAVTVALHSVVVDPPVTNIDSMRVAGPAWTRARLHVTENGIPTSVWKPVEITVSDATGNQVLNSADRQDLSTRPGQPVPGEMEVEIKKGLCPLETAWKLRIKLEKKSGNARVFEFLAKPSSR